MTYINTKAPLGSGPTDVKEQRAISDAGMKERHEMFDLQAQDNTMKYERPQFAVVTASKAFREGWERTFGRDREDAGGSPHGDTGSHQAGRGSTEED